MQSFTSAIKNGYIAANVETLLFEKNDGNPGVLTLQWFTGVFDEQTIIRYYVDGETTPSIEMLLLLGHGVGYTMAEEDPNTPWHSNWVSHEASGGGLYNTYRIPFLSSIKITAENWQQGTYWYIVRGVTNYPIILGDLQLPSNARLYLYKNENVELVPNEFITLADVNMTSGALFGVTLQANSSDFNYLEACMRVKIDYQTNYQYLSSGTEDFFLSAYYFDSGMYHDDNAGCTYLEGPGLMSAYKFFSRDPILFTKGIELVWRCGETSDCPSSFPPGEKKRKPENLQLANTWVTSYTWIYQYSFD